ncbi:uL22 family ribosomal protein [Candidatus Dojkabacteria bacterium]|nr:uL22 family ribosomal protein [Candidatus Dojkabacteria bacterium]
MKGSIFKGPGTCTRKNVYSSLQKAKLVADLIRGMGLQEARATLHLLNKKVAVDFDKCLMTAFASLAEKDKTADESNTVINQLSVAEGRRIRKVIFGARGRASRKYRKYCHIYVKLNKKG